MIKILDIIHLGAKFISIAIPLNLANKLSVPKERWWSRYKITVIDISIQSRENGKKKGITNERKKEVVSPKQLRLIIPEY